MTIRAKAVAVFAAALIALPAAALASGSQSSTITVNGSVIPNCVGFASTNQLTFNAYDVFAAAPDAASTSYAINCTKGSTPNITIDGGQHSNNGNRFMSDGTGNASGVLEYLLYQDAGNSNAWPLGTAVNVPANGNNASTETTTILVSGVIPNGQDVEVGTYSDSLQVTLNF